MSAAARTDNAPAAASDALDKLIALVATDMEAVNATIVERMASDVPMIPALAEAERAAAAAAPDDDEA